MAQGEIIERKKGNYKIILLSKLDSQISNCPYCYSTFHLEFVSICRALSELYI